jgi:DNA-binding winged helix-turn-helix (wHTH) protein
MQVKDIKMDYLFDNNILYRSSDGTLHYLEGGSEETITLPPVLNRILLLLVINQGQVITKEEFLTKVWDNYGKPGSSNTLNQYLSTLRGIFSNHLGKKPIITVPKQGYMLSFEVNITIAEEKPAVEKNEILKEENASEKKAEALPSLGILFPVEKKLIFFYIFILIIAITITVFISKKSDPSIAIHPYYLGKIGECPVYSFSKYETESQKESEMEAVLQQANRYNLDCDANIYFYYYRNENIGYGEKGDYSMLTRCKETNSAHNECLTTRVSW